MPAAPLMAQHTALVSATDIPLFWKAYDAISNTTDSARKLELIQTLYFDKAGEGFKALRQVREYTAADYVNAIKDYPKFWASVRPNMQRVTTYAADINKGIAALRKLYPSMRPAHIYFTVGAMRSNGTTLENKVLIGSELSLADDKTATDEFPAQFQHLKAYFSQNPVQQLVFLNVHEYVHTQQVTTIGNYLLSQCVLEGVAEFVAEKALGVASPNPPIAYGKANDSALKAVFVKSMFSPHSSYWLYSNRANPFGMRDLGYYMGYAICESYYNRAANKQAAIRELITLPYNNEPALFRMIDSAQYFDQPVSVYKQAYLAARPVVKEISGLDQSTGVVAPGKHIVTIRFSAGMDKRFSNFTEGPDVQAAVLQVKKVIGFDETGTAFSFETELLPGKEYQLMVGQGFRTGDNLALAPYLISIRAAGK